MTHPEWRPLLHVAPERGWVNDPNGLCFFRGRYHAFFQYTLDWRESNLRSWGHAVSDDLLTWEELPVALTPDIPEDRCGVYSGCAFVTEDGERMELYYTGNVVYDGPYDRIHEGREANEILDESADGRHFSEKRVLLRPEDYPADCTRHVRDPKVWEKDGEYWMVLGARNLDDHGQVLVYRSDDGISWKHHHTIRSLNPFGYMWECPNVVMLDGHEFLAVCPQGLDSEELRRHNMWQAGYFPVDGKIVEAETVDEALFREWDFGWDFYAPQVFVDGEGRTILIGWMGAFDSAWNSAPDDLEWCHCLTLPRELALGADGYLVQRPVHELEARRGTAGALGEGSISLPDHLADIELAGIAGAGALVLDDVLSIALDGSLLTVSFADDAVGSGRTSRSVALPAEASSLRVIVDRSTVEIYLDGGRTVFSTRWFPEADRMTVASNIPCTTATAWNLV